MGPSFGIAFSVVGFVTGAWLLAIGVEGARGPTEVCGYGEPLCIGRPAPYAGSVLMGLSTFGMARSGKKASERAKSHRLDDRGRADAVPLAPSAHGSRSRA